MVDKYSCVAGSRAEQVSANFYMQQFSKLHTDPFDKNASRRVNASTMHKSVVSEASPNFFRTHPTLKLKPTDYSRKIPLADAYHKETNEFLYPDGRRRNPKLKLNGMEDSAVSKDAPTWFQVKHVTEAPLTGKQSTFSPFWKPPQKANPAAAVSESGPEWMKLKGLPEKPDTHKHGIWDYSWRKEQRVDLDRDSAISNDAPTWFRVDHVPICKRKGPGVGQLDFSYTSDRNAATAAGTRSRPHTSATQQRVAANSRGSTASKASRGSRGSSRSGRTASRGNKSRHHTPLRTAHHYYQAINQIQDQRLEAARARLANLRKLTDPR